MTTRRARIAAAVITLGLAVGLSPAPAGATLGTPPSAPPSVELAPAAGSILVFFEGSYDDGGSPITQYDADCTSSDGGVEATTTGFGTPLSGGSRELDVPGATDGKTYTCSLAAENANGPSSANTDSGTTVPGRPDIPILGHVGTTPTTVTLDLMPAPGGGVRATGVAASCTSSDGGAPGSASRAGVYEQLLTVKGLTAGKTYTCTVTATNARGTSPPSAASRAVTA